MTPKIEVYTTKTCPYCVRAKALLKSRSIAFQEITIDPNDDLQWDALERRSGMQTVPQIFVDGKILGGYTDLADLDARDRLESLKAG
ncbi:MAG: glutaredoxin 3 [Bdellovibrionales bacterium RIFOXYC1_FULL_54_43]|nr:MAG: glutaredoxin 3 [Bdellovibrionales bacterium RIFOXYC1_FULL_54_43]OFZ79316.1 MAG: glutaredoxin 3 [Bdellovibrionales bacterium RIFOXYD1_FULL_55_31]